MINFAELSVIRNLYPPFRLLSLILLTLFTFLHVLHGHLIRLIYQLIRCFTLRDPKFVDPNKTSIFITGCASGFGFQLVTKLASHGYTVFAGVRIMDERSRKLMSSCFDHKDRIHLVKCDVSKKSDIEQAFDYVKNHLNGTKLWAVVNNAAAFQAMPFECRDPESYESEIDVNLISPMNITHTFLPLLRQTPGSRVVFVSSLAGKQNI